MRRPSPAGLAVAIAVSMLPCASLAQSNIFRLDRAGPQLNPSDYDEMLASIDRLNRGEPTMGRTENWSDPKTGASGTSTLIGLRSIGPSTCHMLKHHIATRKNPEGFNYRLTWCPTPGGAWKIHH